MATAKIKILDSTSKIEKNVLSASEPEIKKLFSAAKPKIESEVKKIVVLALMDCPEIKSLKAGTLRMDFGLVIDPTDDIIYSIANSVHILFKNFRFYKNSISNIMSIYIQPSDFQNLLSLPVSNVITEKMEVLPWLEWLLTAGDATVVYGYSVEYGPSPNSRTGFAVMMPGGFFRVDSKFSGTPGDNFITRALEKYSEQITNAIRNNL
jgi:hypothetical protein